MTAGGLPREGIMIRHAARSAVIAGLALAAALPAAAQPAGTLGIDLPVQRTTAAGSPTVSEQRISGDAAIEHWFAADRGRLFYETALDRFNAGGTWSTWLHNAGIAGTFEAGRTAFDAGAAVFWRVNGGGWADAGFSGFTLASAVERTMTRATVSGGYSLYRRDFDDVPALDQFEHFGYGRVLANFESRTTLVGMVSLGWKHYAGDAVPLDGAAPQTLSFGRGAGRGLRSLAVTAPVPGRATPGAARTQWAWSGRIAQSLDDRTGVWVEHSRRRTGGDLPPAVVWTPPLFYDDGVYDDPYAIDAATWSVGAKRVWGRGDEVRVSLSRSARDYAGVAAIDDAGAAGPPRADTLLRAAIEATIPLWSKSTITLDAVGAYGYVDNRSNDAFERYRTHVFSAGLRAGF